MMFTTVMIGQSGCFGFVLRHSTENRSMIQRQVYMIIWRSLTGGSTVFKLSEMRKNSSRSLSQSPTRITRCQKFPNLSYTHCAQLQKIHCSHTASFPQPPTQKQEKSTKFSLENQSIRLTWREVLSIPLANTTQGWCPHLR